MYTRVCRTKMGFKSFVNNLLKCTWSQAEHMAPLVVQEHLLVVMQSNEIIAKSTNITPQFHFLGFFSLYLLASIQQYKVPLYNWFMFDF